MTGPGNVRELQNVIERAVALEADARRAARDPARRTCGARRRRPPPPASGPPPVLPELEEGFDLEARGEEFYRHYLALALARAGGVQVRAAEMLGMSFRSFRYYAKKYGLRGGGRSRHFLTVGLDRNCQLPLFVSPSDAGRTPPAGV